MLWYCYTSISLKQGNEIRSLVDECMNVTESIRSVPGIVSILIPDIINRDNQRITDFSKVSSKKRNHIIGKP